MNVLRRVAREFGRFARRSYRILRPSAHTEGLLGKSIRTTQDNQWVIGARKIAYVARELVRNEAIAARAVDLVAQRAVGRDGIRLRMNTGDTELDQQIESAWALWCREVTPQGHSMRALQDLLIRECATVGEGFAYVLVNNADRLVLQPFEQEDLDLLRGNFISPPEYGGIRFDDYGVPQVYRVARNLPGGFRDYIEFHEIPAARVFHLKRKDRPSASRGTSPFDAVAELIYAISRGTQAELDLLRQSAFFGIHFKTDVPAQDLAMDWDNAHSEIPVNTDPTAPVFSTGGFANIGPYDAKMISADRPGDAYVPFVETQTRLIAARFGVPWSALAGDYSKNSGTNGRLEEISTQSGCFGWQTILMEEFLDRLFPQWAEWAVLTGAIELRGRTIEQLSAAASWLTPAAQMLDPQREAMATQMMLNMGLITWSQALAREGRDAEDQMIAIRREQEQAAREGVVIPRAGAGELATSTITNLEGEGGGENGPATEAQGNATRARVLPLRTAQ